MRVVFVCLVLFAGCTRFNPTFVDGDVDAGIDPGGGSGGNGGGTTACDPSKLAFDPHHCGGCDNDCTRLPNVDPSRVSCSGGVCNVGGACLYNFADCTAAPGCETNIATPDHCGSCTNACTGGASYCSTDGSGHHACSSGCGGTTPDECGTLCVNLQSDPAHCGSCNTSCPTSVPHGSSTCSAGQCATSCDPGYVLQNGGCVPAFTPDLARGGPMDMATTPGADMTNPDCGISSAPCVNMGDCCSGICFGNFCL